MTFDFSVDGILIPVYDGSDFQENNLTITGSGDISVAQSGGVFTVSSITSSGIIESNYLRLDGTNGPMTGQFDLSADPTTNLQPATKQYVDAAESAADAALIAASGVLQTDIDSRVLRAGDTMTGDLVLNADPSLALGAATKQYVDAAAASAVIDVEDDGVSQHDSVGTFNFFTGLTAASGAGDQIDLTVNESELTTFVHLTGAENIAGIKTFDNDVIVSGDLTVNGTTTTLNTDELLVEDNIITLNSTFSGVPSLDAGIEIERGNEDRAQLLWDESLDRFVAGVSGTFTADDQVIVIRSELEAVEADLSSASGTLQADIDTRVLRAGDTMTGDLVLNADPSLALGAATKQYVDAVGSDLATASGTLQADIDTRVLRAGDTMTGSLVLDADPSVALGAATKQYVDAVATDLSTASGTLQADIDTRVLKAGDTMTGNLALATGIDIAPAASGTSDLAAAATPFAELHVDQGFNYDAPTVDDHIANKAYVDAQVSSASIAVEESGASVNDSVNTFNFLNGFTVTSGAGSVDIALDNAELNHMDLLTNQTASGIKTFADGIVLGSLAEPASAGATGTVGDIRWANDYIYVAVATDTWKRVAIASF